ncbi:hypothetical protein HanPI659440_Chr01g0023421 [Helianthus annuus]|nr:hypothetical protein HanPI659440_Chr01g0023421 [Helianthus annuus]
MRCNNHYTDLSSAIGVCASCLRERLSSLISDQQQLQTHIQNFAGTLEKTPPENCRKSDRSDVARRLYPPAVPRHHHSHSDQLFHRTPEVKQKHATAGHNGGDSKKKRSFIRLISFTNLFRSRNRNPIDSVTDPRVSDSTFGKSCGRNNATSSWFSISSIVSGDRYRRKKTVSTDEPTTTGPVRRKHGEDRGMSPVRNADVIIGTDDDELRNTTSGYESTESWRNTPRRTPAVWRGGSGGHVRNISGLTFCLSPLVRASPNLQWNQKGLPPDVVWPDGGAPVKAHLSYTKSFCANRSRKLADLGRVNPNR